MRRLFYVAEHIDDVEAVYKALHEEGVSDWHLHVLAKDEAGLYTHKVHSATPFQQLDVLHTGARFALVGAGIGLVLGLVGFVLSNLGVLSLDINGYVVAGLGFVGLCFGAWEGGMIGLTRENYKIERFHDDIEAGRYLLLVDVSKVQRPLVKELMNVDFPHVPYRGGTSTRLGIFERPKTLHHQTTH